MTREDTIRILEKVFRLYMTQARKLSADEKISMVMSWEETFRSDSYDDVERAVNNYVRHGNAFIPLPGDIVRELSAVTKVSAGKAYTEVDKLFKRLVETADTLANNKERISITDPGGFRWNEELQRKVYYHPETVISTKSFTQYDFANLPREIQEYVEDINGLRYIWREIESSRELARKRFEERLPAIKATLAERDDRTVADQDRLDELIRSMTGRRKNEADL